MTLLLRADVVAYVALTEQAITTLAALDEPLLVLHRTLLGHLSPTELKEVIRVLEKMREKLLDADE